MLYHPGPQARALGDKQVRGQPFLNGRLFKNHCVFISTCNALPVSVYKHPGIYKQSVNMTG